MLQAIRGKLLEQQITRNGLQGILYEIRRANSVCTSVIFEDQMRSDCEDPVVYSSFKIPPPPPPFRYSLLKLCQSI